MRTSDEIKKGLQQQLGLEILQEIDNGEEDRPHIYKVKEQGTTWFVKVVEFDKKSVSNVDELSDEQKLDIYQQLELERNNKRREMNMWQNARDNEEYGKYILAFYRHEFIKWENYDTLGVDLVMYMPEAECLVDHLKKYSCNEGKGDPEIVETEETVFQIGIDICRALIAMEEAGIYHRDIKPGNIYFYEGRYVLGDFGIAVSKNQKRSSWTIQFTKSYCSPEQRKNIDCDQRMDIYSFGLVLFELSYPDWAGNYNEKIHRSMISDPELLPTIDSSDSLNKIIHKACHVRKEDRYYSAKEMLKDLMVARCPDDKTELVKDGDPYREENFLLEKKNINADTVWKAGKFWYENSRTEGNRFENFEIDKKLMSAVNKKTNIKDMEEFPIYVYEEENSEKKQLLDEIISESGNQHLYLVGEGGIGKTTALYSIMETAYRDTKFDSRNVTKIPLFIELSKAPDEYKDVYKEGHSTFIRRCIMMQIKAWLCGDRFRLDRDIFEMDEKDVVLPINALLHRVENVQYVLLLDGLNEVSVKRLEETGTSVMAMIIGEINHLMDKNQYPRVKVILTGRRDENIGRDDIIRYHLTGVQDIIGYLKENKVDITGIEDNKRLYNTLKNPLFLKLYCRISLRDNVSTQGEIFNVFFNEHRKELYPYTAKIRIEQTDQDLRDMASIKAEKRIDAKMQYFILDFLLPEIGWYMEKYDLYILDIDKLHELICEILTGRKENDICGKNGMAVFEEYQGGIGVGFDTRKYAELLLKLGSTERECVEAILDCCISSFGILYKNKDCEYGFVHQHIRDYFAAMRIINHIRIALYIKKEEYMADFNDSILSENVARFIGEILGEYRNVPEEKDGIWESIVPQEDYKRSMIARCIDLYRDHFLTDGEENYGVRNLLKIVYEARKTLAACNLSKLDLRFCTLNDIELYNADFTGSLVQKETIFPVGHKGAVYNAIFSPNGEYIFSCGEDGTVRKWHAKTKKYKETIIKYPYRVHNIGFSNDGKYFFVATPKKVDVMDASEFKIQHTFKGAANAVFSPDSQLMAVVFRRKKVQIIDLKDFSCKGKLDVFSGGIHSICFSPNSQKIAYRGKKCIELWDVNECKKLGIFEDSYLCTSIEFSPSGMYLAWGTKLGTMVVCKSDPQNPFPIKYGEESGARITALRFVMKDDYIVVGYDDGRIMSMNLLNGEKSIRELNVVLPVLNISVFCNNTSTYLVVTVDQNFYVWDMNKKKQTMYFEGNYSCVCAMKHIPEEGIVIILATYGSALVWNVEKNKVIGYFENNKSNIIDVDYSDKSKKIVFASIDGTVFVWNTTPFSYFKQYMSSITGPIQVMFNEDGRYILVSSYFSKEIKIYDTQTDAVQIINSPVFNRHVIFFKDEKKILTIGSGKCFEIDRETKKQEKYYEYRTPYKNNWLERLVEWWDEQRNVSFEEVKETLDVDVDDIDLRIGSIRFAISSSDKQRLYLGTYRGYIEVFETEGNRCLALLKCNKNPIECLMLSSDGKYFTGISGVSGEKIKIFDSETYQCKYIVPKSKKSERTCLEFVDDNQQIYVGDKSGMIEIWERKGTYELAAEQYKYNKNLKNFCRKLGNWLYVNYFVNGREEYDYYLTKTIPYVRGLKVNGAQFTQLHPDSTLTEEDLNILDIYSAVVK